jgi:hypothetical protein
MASFNPVTKKFTYTAADERLIENARSLFSAIAEYGDSTETKQSAATAYNAAQHVLKHVQAKRGTPT